MSVVKKNAFSSNVSVTCVTPHIQLLAELITRLSGVSLHLMSRLKKFADKIDPGSPKISSPVLCHTKRFGASFVTARSSQKAATIARVAAMGSSADLFLGERDKPPLDQIQP